MFQTTNQSTFQIFQKQASTVLLECHHVLFCFPGEFLYVFHDFHGHCFHRFLPPNFSREVRPSLGSPKELHLGCRARPKKPCRIPSRKLWARGLGTPRITCGEGLGENRGTDHDMCVCVCMYIHICLICVYIYIHTCVYLYKYIYTNIFISLYIYVYIYIYMYLVHDNYTADCIYMAGAMPADLCWILCLM